MIRSPHAGLWDCFGSRGARRLFVGQLQQGRRTEHLVVGRRAGRPGFLDIVLRRRFIDEQAPAERARRHRRRRASGSTVAPGDENGLIPTDSIWHTTSEWYRNIATAPTTDESDALMSTLSEFGKQQAFWIDFSFNVLDATGGVPTTFPPNDEGDSVPVPIPPNGYVEGDHPYTGCPDGDDCHVLIVDRVGHQLFELYQVHESGSTWNGYVALWKLDQTYPRENRGKGCTSADAAGLAITPGLIGYQETKHGAINHALRLVLENDWIRGHDSDKTVPSVVYPASHGSTAGGQVAGLPYGARLRLKSTIVDTDPRIKTPGAHAVVTALRTYGMIVADGGNIPLLAESVKVAHDADPTATWDGLLGEQDLGFIQPSDFEVIAIPKDNPSNPTAGWYQTKADYEAQLQTPLGCNGIVQP